MTATEDVKAMIEVHEHLYHVIEQIVPGLAGKRILDAGAGWQDKTDYKNTVGSIFWLPELFEEHDYVSMDIRPKCGCEVTGDIEELEKFIMVNRPSGMGLSDEKFWDDIFDKRYVNKKEDDGR